MMQNNKLLVALKRASASEMKRFYFSRRSKWRPFTFMHAHLFHWSTASSMTFCDTLPMFNEALLQVAGVASFASQLLKSK